jgi:DNA polymerase elongation subunit (family B)
MSDLLNIDLDSLSLDELQHLADQLETESAKFTAYEQAVKLTLNSIYGAFGNKWFHFFNIDIAESITIQGKNAILYSEKILNRYFNEFYHKDKELHSKLNISVTRKLEKPAVIYIDTDSCYVRFEEMFEATKFEGEPMSIDHFIMYVYNNRLKDYIVKCMEKYAEVTNTDNFLVFELETIAHSGIWMAKKKYIQDIAWTDKLKEDQRYDRASYIKTIGFEVIQSSTPTFARKKLNEALQLIFKSDSPSQESIVNFLREAKREFKLADIDDIAFNKRTNNIQKYILDDYETFQFASKTPPNVKAGGYYNYLLNNSKYKKKYKAIGNGEKLKIYHISEQNGLSDVFAYLPGEHPYEFAPKVDHDLQFEKAIIDPMNRVLASLNMKPLDRNLIFSSSLFDF